MHNDASCINMSLEHIHLNRDNFSSFQEHQRYHDTISLGRAVVHNSISDLRRDFITFRQTLSVQSSKIWIFYDSLSWIWLLKRHMRTDSVSFLLFTSIFLCIRDRYRLRISHYNNSNNNSKIVTIFCIYVPVKTLRGWDQNIFHCY